PLPAGRPRPTRYRHDLRPREHRGRVLRHWGPCARRTPQEVAVEVPVFTRMAIERAARYAFGLAERRRQRFVSVTKSNASRYAYVLWDEVVEEVARDFGGVELQRMHVDAMAARMVLRPDSIDVV